MLSESTPLKAPLAKESAPASTTADGPSTVTPRQGGEGNIISTFMNIVNSMIGSGLVVLPHAFSQSGWEVGLGMVTLSAIVAVITTDFISESLNAVNGESSFRTISNAAFPHLSLFSDLSVVISMGGAGCIYIIVAAEMMQDGFGGPREFWVALIGLIILPLSFLRSVDSLRFTSTLAVVMFTYIMLLVAAFAVGGMITPIGEWFNSTHAFNGTHVVQYNGTDADRYNTQFDPYGTHAGLVRTQSVGAEAITGDYIFVGAHGLQRGKFRHFQSSTAEDVDGPTGDAADIGQVWQTPEEAPFDLDQWRSRLGGAGLIDPCPPEDEHSQPGADLSCHRTSTEGVGSHPTRALGAIALQFACQPTAPAMRAALHNPTRTRVLTVYSLAVGFVWLFYFIIALCGYYTFGNNVHQNILLMYPKNYLTFGGTLCLGCIAIFTFPLSSLPFRTSIISLVQELGSIVGEWGGKPASKAPQQAPAGKEDDGAPESGGLSAVVEVDAAPRSDTVFLDEPAQVAAVSFFVVGCLSVAFITNDLGPIVDFVGSIGMDSIGITAPALIYIGVHRRVKNDSVRCYVSLAAVFALYGITLTILGTVMPLVSGEDPIIEAEEGGSSIPSSLRTFFSISNFPELHSNRP